MTKCDIIDISMLEYLRNDSIFALYVVELCSYIVSNVSNKVQIQKFCHFIQSFIKSPIANFQGNSSQRVRKGVVKMTKRNLNQTLVHYLICKHL